MKSYQREDATAAYVSLYLIISGSLILNKFVYIKVMYYKLGERVSSLLKMFTYAALQVYGREHHSMKEVIYVKFRTA